MLVTKGVQSLDLDPIALAPGRALHSDEVIERRDGDGEVASDHEPNGVDRELPVGEAFRRSFPDAVEVAEPRAKEEVRPAQDRAFVDVRGGARWEIAPARVQLGEGSGEPSDVRSLAVVHDVEVAGHRGGTVQRTGDAADDDEPDLVPHERPQQLAEIERRWWSASHSVQPPRGAEQLKDARAVLRLREPLRR